MNLEKILSGVNPVYILYTPPISEICIMCQKCEGNCGLWVLNQIIKKYAENMKKIAEIVWELPAK